jgi:hypothetical protein
MTEKLNKIEGHTEQQKKKLKVLLLSDDLR